MIQDIAPHRLYNEFQRDQSISENDLVFAYNQGKILVEKVGRTIRLPRACELETTGKEIYLLKLDDSKIFLADQIPEENEHLHYYTLKELRNNSCGPLEMMFLLYTARHLASWYLDNRFCGTCGHKTVHDHKERAMLCPSCGRKIYPRLLPAVIVGVVSGDELLLTKYAGKRFAQNALVAGFTEIGESLEGTVRREVMEETGLKVKNITYYKSQPWGSADDILMGFYCQVDGPTTIHRDEEELMEAAFTKREDIVLQTDDYSLTNEMMRRFKEGYDPFA